MGIARAIVKGFANIGFRLLYRVDIKGLENIECWKDNNCSEQVG